MTMLQLSQVFERSATFSMKVYNLLLIYVIGMVHILDIISNLFLNFVRKGKKQLQLQYLKDPVNDFNTANTECGEQIPYNRSVSESAVRSTKREFKSLEFTPEDVDTTLYKRSTSEYAIHTTESETPISEFPPEGSFTNDQNSYDLKEENALSYNAMLSSEQDTTDIENNEIRTDLIQYDINKLYTIRNDVMNSNYKPAFLFNNFVLNEINKSSAHAEKSRVGAAKKKINETANLKENTDMVIDVEISGSDDIPTVHKSALKTKLPADLSGDEENVNSNLQKSKTLEKNSPEKKNNYAKKKKTMNNTNIQNNSKEIVINASTDQDWRRKSEVRCDEEIPEQKFKWYNRREQKRPQYQTYKRSSNSENP